MKPTIKLVGKDGNIFSILGRASRALTKNGQSDKINDMRKRVENSDSYTKALSIIGEYVDFD